MIRITKDEIMHPLLVVSAKCFHQRRGDTRIHVPTMFTIARQQDGCGAEIYLLTRYVGGVGTANAGIAMSGIVKWDHEREIVSEEECYCRRKDDGKMISAWIKKLSGGEQCARNWT